MRATAESTVQNGNSVEVGQINMNIQLVCVCVYVCAHANTGIFCQEWMQKIKW